MIISTRSTFTKMANYPGTNLVGVAYKLRKKMKNSPPCVHILHKSLNVVISCCCFAEDEKEMYQNVKRTCRAIVFALRSYGNYFCDRLRSCDRDRRRSQKIEPCSISCDRLRSIAIVCDLRSAICDPRSYGNQPLDRTWFYLLRSRSQDRRRSQK